MARRRAGESAAPRLSSGWLQRALACGIGLVSSLLGIGGGSLAVPALAMSGVPMHRAVGTASAVGLLVSLPATLAFMLSPSPEGALPPGSFGHVNLLAFALLAPAGMLAAPWGARLAHRWPPDRLQRVFAVLLLVIAARMIAATLP
jgi:uncharacterized membrane protein YfcA